MPAPFGMKPVFAQPKAPVVAAKEESPPAKAKPKKVSVPQSTSTRRYTVPVYPNTLPVKGLKRWAGTSHIVVRAETTDVEDIKAKFGTIKTEIRAVTDETVESMIAAITAAPVTYKRRAILPVTYHTSVAKERVDINVGAYFPVTGNHRPIMVDMAFGPPPEVIYANPAEPTSLDPTVLPPTFITDAPMVGEAALLAACFSGGDSTVVKLAMKIAALLPEDAQVLAHLDVLADEDTSAELQEELLQSLDMIDGEVQLLGEHRQAARKAAKRGETEAVASIRDKAKARVQDYLDNQSDA